MPAVEPRSAPNRIPLTDRPIALAIAPVRMDPAAPTSVPDTSNNVLPIAHPEAATARPVRALSREITIGTSAPPTGSTNSTPTTRASNAVTIPATTPAVTPTTTAAARPASTATTIATGAPGSTTGREVISPCNLAKVISDPDSDTEPATIPNAAAALATPVGTGNAPATEATPISVSSMMPTSAA